MITHKEPMTFFGTDTQTMVPPGGVMQRIVNRNDQLNTQTQLSYINSFGLHNIDALLGFETQDTEYAFNYMAGQDYPGDLYELTNAGSTSAETNRQSLST